MLLDIGVALVESEVGWLRFVRWAGWLRRGQTPLAAGFCGLPLVRKGADPNCGWLKKACWMVVID